MTKNIKIAAALLCILWAIRIIDFILPIDFNQFGIIPRTFRGLPGIVFSPFLHGSFIHLISNSIPFFVLILVLLTFYEKIALQVILLFIVCGGLLVWIFARSSSHVGASGLIYSLTAFLIAGGIFMRNLKSMVIAVVIFFLYGGLMWGVFPTRPWVSWEGHLFGFIVGVGLAYLYGKMRKAPAESPSGVGQEKGSFP